VGGLYNQISNPGIRGREGLMELGRGKAKLTGRRRRNGKGSDNTVSQITIHQKGGNIPEKREESARRIPGPGGGKRGGK